MKSVKKLYLLDITTTVGLNTAELLFTFNTGVYAGDVVLVGWDEMGCCWFSPSSLPRVSLLWGWNALTGGGGREYYGGWEFGWWSLSSSRSVYILHTHTHTRTHTHTHPESGRVVNSSSSSLWLSSGRLWCWRELGGGWRGGAVIKELWERGPCALLDAFHPPTPTP